MATYGAKRTRFAKWRVDQAIHDALGVARKRKYAKFEPLLRVVCSRSDMLRQTHGDGRAGWSKARRTLHGMLALCKHERDWICEPEEWEPVEAGYLEQFGSLARHLFASHPVPRFMTLVWFERCPYAAERNQTLFRHLGLGNSVRGADLAIRLTRSMATHFMIAPDHFRVEQAIRYGQVRGLGGDHRFAATVACTRVGHVFEHERYWRRVFSWLGAGPGLPGHLVRPCIEFFRQLREECGERKLRQVTALRFDTFVGRLRHWHADRPQPRPKTLTWPTTGIRGLRFTEPCPNPWSFRCWTIRELCSSDDLTAEGKDLHHCVGGYSRVCAKGDTSIWSLRSHGSLTSHRVLTIEVCPLRRRIVTALGERNSRPKAAAREVMEMWAAQEGLTISSSV